MVNKVTINIAPLIKEINKYDAKSLRRSTYQAAKRIGFLVAKDDKVGLPFEFKSGKNKFRDPVDYTLKSISYSYFTQIFYNFNWITQTYMLNELQNSELLEKAKYLSTDPLSNLGLAFDNCLSENGSEWQVQLFFQNQLVKMDGYFQH